MGRHLSAYAPRALFLPQTPLLTQLLLPVLRSELKLTCFFHKGQQGGKCTVSTQSAKEREHSKVLAAQASGTLATAMCQAASVSVGSNQLTTKGRNAKTKGTSLKNAVHLQQAGKALAAVRP